MRPIVDIKPGQRAIPFTLNGEQFVARGDGQQASVVAKSIARRVENNGITLWPGNEIGEYRASWYDPEQEVFCEAQVKIESARK